MHSFLQESPFVPVLRCFILLVTIHATPIALVWALCNGPVYRQGWTGYESDKITQLLFPDGTIQPSWTRNVKRTGMHPTVKDLKRRPPRRQEQRAGSAV